MSLKWSFWGILLLYFVLFEYLFIVFTLANMFLLCDSLAGCGSQNEDIKVTLLMAVNCSLLLHTDRTLHRYHACVCGFRSGVTSPELFIMLSYCCLEMF